MTNWKIHTAAGILALLSIMKLVPLAQTIITLPNGSRNLFGNDLLGLAYPILALLPLAFIYPLYRRTRSAYVILIIGLVWAIAENFPNYELASSYELIAEFVLLALLIWDWRTFFPKKA